MVKCEPAEAYSVTGPAMGEIRTGFQGLFDFRSV
jgi:hypothetical protein